MSDVQLLLLAAGGSRRMGEPKQLLKWGTTTLIEHQLHNLLDTGMSVSVILGAYTGRILPLIDAMPIRIIHNERWEEGMGTSIAKGANQVLEQHPTMDGLLISLLDQPLLTTAYFNKMLQAFQPDNKQIIVSKSNTQWSGAPVLFDKTYVNELIRLKGDQGAKIVTSRYQNKITSVDAGSILSDVDTPQSYHELLRQYLGMK